MSLQDDLRFQKLQHRYRQCTSKLEKHKVLNIICEYNPEIHRKHMIRLMKPHIADGRRKKPRGCPVTYPPQVREIIVTLWNDAGMPSPKRMSNDFFDRWLPHYESEYGIPLTDEIRALVKSVKPTAMNTYVKRHRLDGLKGLSLTKRSRSRYMEKIPVSQRASIIDTPGYVEADTVAHCGNNASGAFLSTLQATDIATGWSVMEPLARKGDDETYSAFCTMEKRFPFAIKEFDSDCGQEFLNGAFYHGLMGRKNVIVQTRSRPYKKNDNAHIEQKNKTNVRAFLGYQRYETNDQNQQLQMLYRTCLEDYINYFQPSVKLLTKTYVGKKCMRTYDVAKTPAQRVLESTLVPDHDKAVLRAKERSLNPYLLKIKIEGILKKLSTELSTMRGPQK